MTHHRTATIVTALAVWACNDTPAPHGSDTAGDATGGSSSGSDSPTLDAADGTDVTTAGDEGPPLQFEVVEVDEPVDRPTDLRFLPGRYEFFVLSKDGDVAHYALADNDSPTASMVGSFVVPDVHSESDCGLISVAFDPDFEDNRFFYVGTCISQFDSGIFRLELLDDYDAIPDTMTEIMIVGHASASNPWHNVGSIGFDPQGYLWALFGDKTVKSSAQNRASNLGSLVRIIPDRTPDGSGYEPAPDNPYYGDPDFSWDIFAYGLRSPWRGLLDRQGRYWVADVGANSAEEINVISAPGTNLGWPTHEGPCVEGDCRGYHDPVTSWPHGPHPYMEDDEDVEPVSSRVAWVGLIYEDRGNDRYDGLLTDKVLFGDRCLGYLRTLVVDDDGNVVSDEHVGHLPNASAWDQGPDGYVYTVTYGGCGSLSVEPDPPPAVLHRAVPRR